MPRNFETPHIDQIEDQDNETLERASRLIHLIESDLDPSDFTLKEIQESFNSLTRKRDSEKTDFGSKDLKILIENGFIQEFNNGHYEVINSIEN